MYSADALYRIKGNVHILKDESVKSWNCRINILYIQKKHLNILRHFSYLITDCIHLVL